MAGSGVRVFVSGANDDFLEVDDVIARSDGGRGSERDRDRTRGGYELLGMGWGNPTPVGVPARHLRGGADRAHRSRGRARCSDLSRAIFSLHVPPLGSGLDIAPKLDDYLRPRVGAMGFEMVPVGSTATRDAIERYQPMLGLHGHIHESKGVKRLGKTPIANPGSEYGEGILDGVIIDIDDTGVVNMQLVSG